ncbi:MAG: hypothetical protein ACI4EX_02975 [Lachnospiraceae bacterium]
MIKNHYQKWKYIWSLTGIVTGGVTAGLGVTLLIYVGITNASAFWVLGMNSLSLFNTLAVCILLVSFGLATVSNFVMKTYDLLSERISADK